MNAYGSDRVRAVDGRFILSSRLPKGWTARIERTLTQSEFPGTAVLWDGEYFEVIAAEALPQGVRYTLEPWTEHHMMRTTSRYDAESEAQRMAEWRAAVVREQKRKTVGLLALVTGHFPAIVQERLASELGVVASRLTLVSIVSELGVVAAIAFFCAAMMMSEHRLPIVPVIIAFYLIVETSFRFMINWIQGRAIGSSAGTLGYIAWWLVSGRDPAKSPFEAPPGHAVTISETPSDRVLHDAMTMREPFATLLPVRDQIRLRDLHGYDYRRSAPTIAGMILLFAILGIVTSIVNHAFVSLAIAAAFAIEQIVRLAAFRRGPAASMLGFAVRPFLRNLL